jgi:hypothetical protein
MLGMERGFEVKALKKFKEYTIITLTTTVKTKTKS